MTELMIKMTSWLVASMALGFIVAWLLSRNLYKNRQTYNEDILSSIILERNNMIDKLEKSFRKRKILSESISNDLEESNKALAEKTSLLTTLENKFDNSNNSQTESLELKQANTLLSLKMKVLEAVDNKRLKELDGFEEVLVLAESKIEDNEKNYRQVLKKLDNDIEILTLGNETHVKNTMTYQKIISNVEAELKLYQANSSDSEFIISKDQFVRIEEQLERYKEEIASLKNEKNKLFLNADKDYTAFHSIDRTLEKERDDGLMVKAFRETYKKITNS